jgi:2-polyprenyl-3-methyl-5-hydroxy-6-metoxy-1,4-benzoquinol methylase
MPPTIPSHLSRVSPLAEARHDTRELPYAKRPWLLKQCNETGFVFLENPPTYVAFEADFAWEKTWQAEVDRRRKAEPIRYALSTAMKHFRNRVLKRNKVIVLSSSIIKRSGVGAINIIDIGCGWGTLVGELIANQTSSIRERCVPHGIEISAGLAAIAQKNFAAVGGRCAQNNAVDGMAEFPPNHFQLIVMSSFLEHEINPLPLLRRCQNCLSDDGRIVIKVPNFDSINRHLRGARWCGFRWPDHVNYFTPNTLSLMAARAGLRVVRMNFFDRNPVSDSLYAVLAKQSTRVN